MRSSWMRSTVSMPPPMRSAVGMPISPAGSSKNCRRTMPESLVVIFAFLDQEPVAAAICLRSGDTLYGRHWGSEQEFHSLHFETCYYQGIEYCIRERSASTSIPAPRASTRSAAVSSRSIPIPATGWRARNSTPPLTNISSGNSIRSRPISMRRRRICPSMQPRNPNLETGSTEMRTPPLRWIRPEDPPEAFPDPALALSDPDGLLAVGGDLSPARLLYAYRHGIFPWYHGDQPILWWSPDPCAPCSSCKDVHISRSLRRRMADGGFTVTLRYRLRRGDGRLRRTRARTAGRRHLDIARHAGGLWRTAPAGCTPIPWRYGWRVNSPAASTASP